LGLNSDYGKLSAVITFLVVTSIINIALGYALAVYLGSTAALHPKGQAVEAAPAMPIAAGAPFAMERPAFTWPMDGVAIPTPTAPATVATAASTGVAPSFMAASASPADEAGVPTRTAEMEQDLLAGIEEFRNQLAQLKGQGFEGLIQGTLAGEPVGAS
jgi:hypothetical protein